MVAYFGWFPAWFLTYQTLQYYPQYVGLDSVSFAVGLPLGFATGLAYAVARIQHSRVIREAEQPSHLRKTFVQWIALEHVVGLATALIAIPQVLTISSRAAPFVMVLVPLFMLLFSVGSLALSWSAVTFDSLLARRDLKAGIGLHAAPLGMALLVATYVVFSFILQGNLTYRDGYYQTVTFMPTLILTAPMAVSWLAVALRLSRIDPGDAPLTV